MREGVVTSSLVVLAGVLAGLGCGGGASSSVGGAESSGGEPALVISDPGEWQALAATGKATYDVACGACHPGGDADLGPALKNHRTPFAVMAKQIREGSGRMKPIGEDKLPESEMRGLMVYLATLNAVGGVQGP